MRTRDIKVLARLDAAGIWPDAVSRLSACAGDWGSGAYCFGAVVLTCSLATAGRARQGARTLNATGVEFGFLMVRVLATSTVKGPGGQSARAVCWRGGDERRKLRSKGSMSTDMVTLRVSRAVREARGGEAVAGRVAVMGDAGGADGVEVSR